jgi:nucleotide-binding universal stress UspA family protein
MVRRILIPMDGTPCSEQAARFGIHLARRTNASLAFGFVVNDHNLREGFEGRETRRALGQGLLESWVRRAEAAGVQARHTVVTGPNVTEALASVAEFTASDLIVIGTHGREGLPRLLWGSVAESLAQKTLCPVIFVRDTKKTTEHDLGRILVAVDTDELCNAVLDQAAMMARDLNASLELLHVIPDLPVRPVQLEVITPDNISTTDALQRESEELLGTAWNHLRALGFEPSRMEVRETRAEGLSVPEVILTEARSFQAGLIVIGTNARHGLEKLLMGSIAEAVIHHADTPVLLVRAPTVHASALNEKPAHTTAFSPGPFEPTAGVQK